jgi:hypothetical protein
MLRLVKSEEASQSAWLQHPRKINGDNLNNMRREATSHFRNKQGIYERKN